MGTKVMPAMAGSILRHGLTFGAGLLVAKGVVSVEQAPEVIGLGMGLASVGWSLLNKKRAKNQLKAAMRAPATHVD